MAYRPKRAPNATKNIAKAYFSDHQAAHDAASVYIAKVDGKNAGLAINIPAENN